MTTGSELYGNRQPRKEAQQGSKADYRPSRKEQERLKKKDSGLGCKSRKSLEEDQHDSKSPVQILFSYLLVTEL